VYTSLSRGNRVSLTRFQEILEFSESRRGCAGVQRCVRSVDCCGAVRERPFWQGMGIVQDLYRCIRFCRRLMGVVETLYSVDRLYKVV
jgi:hypothetical protein